MINKQIISILGLLPINYKYDIDYINKVLINLENDDNFKN